MDWLKTIAPTIATALGGPLAGLAVNALGSALGLSDATKDTINDVLTSGSMTGEQVAAIKQAELEMVKHERELGFRFSELGVKDRDSARTANVQGGTQKYLFWLSLVLLSFCLGIEGWVLFNGMPDQMPDIVSGRVLGLFDAVTMMVLAYWYGTTNGSAIKSDLLAKAPPVK